MELKKLIIAPDSFKGALTARQVADIIAEEAKKHFPLCEIIKIPIADGGEGSLETILTAISGQLYSVDVESPDKRTISANFAVTDNNIAIIEMAQSSGLTRQIGLHPMSSNTFGFGQLIKAALERGARDFILCIGGSATTDGGCGMAAALGVCFEGADGERFVPGGGTLADIKRIDMSELDPRIGESRFTVMCDVESPLFGPDGAAFFFGAQKGANSGQQKQLDDGLRHLGGLFAECLGADVSHVPGAGAAGGLGAGCMAFLGARLESGSETILKLCGFPERLPGCGLIITGEGRLDEQSFKGKVLSGILRLSGDIPVFSICGVNQCGEALLRAHKLRAFAASKGISVQESMAHPEKYLRIAAERAMLWARDAQLGGTPQPHFSKMRLQKHTGVCFWL